MTTSSTLPPPTAPGDSSDRTDTRESVYHDRDVSSGRLRAIGGATGAGVLLASAGAVLAWRGFAGRSRHSDPEAARRSDTRACMRVRARFAGRLSGPNGSVQFTGIDLHYGGIGAKVWRRLEPGSTVFVHLQTFHQMGFAYVRHCTWRGLGGFHVGLEFRSPLARCDADGIPAYLESSNPRNIGLYQRHGFEVRSPIQVGSSPEVVPMLRLPR